MKVTIICHDGKSYVANVPEGYTAADTLRDIKDSDGLVAIGDVLVHKTNISRVVPAEA